MKPILNTLSLTVGNIGLGAFQWFIFVIIAHHYNASTLGHFALLMSTITPLFLFANLGLRPLYMGEKTPTLEKTQIYFTSRFYLTLAVSIFAIPITYLAFPGSFDFWLVGGIVVARAGEAIIDFTTAVLHKQHRFYTSSALMALRAIILTALFAVTLPLVGIQAAIISYAIGTLACVLMLDIPWSISERPLLIHPSLQSFKTITTLLWLSAPLGLTAGLISLLQLIPRTILDTVADTATVGHYSALIQLVQLGTMVAISIGQFVTPRLNVAYHDNNRAVFWYILAVASFPIAIGGILAIALAIFAGGPIITLMYGPDFTETGRLLPLMVLGGIFSCISNVLGFALTAACIRATQVYLAATTLLLAFVANVALIHAMAPLKGAAIAFIFVNVAHCILTLTLLNWRIPIPFLKRCAS